MALRNIFVEGDDILAKKCKIVCEILYENGYSYPTGSELVDKYNNDNWGFWY